MTTQLVTHALVMAIWRSTIFVPMLLPAFPRRLAAVVGEINGPLAL